MTFYFPGADFASGRLIAEFTKTFVSITDSLTVQFKLAEAVGELVGGNINLGTYYDPQKYINLQNNSSIISGFGAREHNNIYAVAKING